MSATGGAAGAAGTAGAGSAGDAGDVAVAETVIPAKEPAATRRRARGRRPPRAAASGVGAQVLLWGYAFVALAPLLLMLVSSFRPERDLVDEPLGISRPVIDNYARAWSEGGFSAYLLFSVVITVSAVALGAGVSMLAAYPLARYRFVGAGFLSAFFLSGLMLPIRLGVVPVYYLMNSIGLADSEERLCAPQALAGVLGADGSACLLSDAQIGLTLVYAASGVPFSVFVLTAFFRQLPGELEEAARIDGAGEFHIFGRIMVPLAKPALATVMLFQFIPLWNDFFFPLILVSDTERYTLPVGLTQFVTEFQTLNGPLYAGLVMTTIPLVVLFLVATKQIVAGLTAGMSR